MPQYYPEMHQVLAQANSWTLEECLQHIDCLYGRDRLAYGASLEEVREECKNQIREDFTDFDYENYFGQKAKRNY